MRHSKLGIGSLLGVGIALAGTLAMAPVSAAVTPDTATLSFDCGSYGSGTATLTATQNGTDATISVSTSAISSPIDLGANSVASQLTMTKNGTDTTVFSGNSNPAIPAGGAVSTGPLTGTVAPGDKLEGSSLQVVVLGITATCKATSPQTPGPFVF
ncbi:MULTISPECIES: hypothetical protein [Streptomyces]|uniref:Uncharacterized protein n=1 Tax=Streptomyces noursei TaxID=1971 RepID=A0A2N8P7F2_STRNR|nr:MULTISPECIES: hypothetical protein [Streptomyces]PNE36945.1 hypothetical protein AOB60_20995 [Streptomyces noursei]QRX95172.1 hypothetical protein JNO44_34040 [Streptomyces noursei]UJB46004.1 hypothetical protein HRD51_39355 [Streptomyces sp. A1-5]